MTPVQPSDREWFDADAGPVVRPYALTGGLTRPSGQRFDLLDLVGVVRRPEELPDLRFQINCNTFHCGRLVQHLCEREAELFLEVVDE